MIHMEVGQERDRYFLKNLGSCLGLEGQMALGCRGGVLSARLAQEAASGAKSSGGVVLHHRLTTPAQGAWLAQSRRLPISLYVEERAGRVGLHLFGGDGLPVGHSREEKLRLAMLGRGCCPPGLVQPGGEEQLWVTPEHYCRDAVARGRLKRRGLRAVTVAVPGDSPENRVLGDCLRLMGCTVEEEWRRGVPEFSAGRGGFALWAREERGSLLEPEQLRVLLCLIEMENGGGKVALPDQASVAADLVAAGFGSTCLRPGREGQAAWRLYASLPWLWDACFGAVRILSRMTLTGESLESLISKTPRFSTRRREVVLDRDLAAMLEELSRDSRSERLGEGLRLRTGNGWVYLSPVRQGLRVVAESPDMELAAELCDLYVGRLQRAGGRGRISSEK